MVMNDDEQITTKSSQYYARRNRPRAKSTGMIPTTYTAIQIKLDGNKLCQSKEESNDGTEQETSDQTTPLVSIQRKKTMPAYLRSYSLDWDPVYRNIIYESSVPNIIRSHKQLRDQKQNSVVTIFAIWNTVVGSSLLAIPWCVQHSGLLIAFFLLVSIASLSVYTAYRILQVQEDHGIDGIGEVPFLCRALLGPWAEYTARIFSLAIIFGANVVYWILMSNFLYNFVGYISGIIFNTPLQSTQQTVLCPSQENSYNVTTENVEFTLFQKIWDLNKTVPVYLIVLVTPLLNFQSASFFTKFNSIGTLSVLYLLIFVIVKGNSWGINLDWEKELTITFTLDKFATMAGMLPLSLFIHNIVITLMRNNRNQGNNNRDLSIAYLLIVLTYLLIGFTFYICFPIDKSCIEDNMLNNFPNDDMMTAIARIFLLFQLLTVYPLLSYMLRIQIFSSLNYPQYPGTFQITLLNSTNVFICALFAILLPKIGTIIRFTGAICGFVYIFTLPSLLHMSSQSRKNKLTATSIFIHVVIIILGFTILVAQFFVTD